MKKILFPLLSAVFSIIIFATCKKTEEAPAKKPPVANAGADVTIYIPTNSITLDGSASRDPDGNIIRYEWTKLSGPDSFKIVNASAVRTIVKNLKWGTYRFQLQVTDSNNLSAKDTVLIKVHGLAPIANAGADVSISLSSCSDNNGFADLDGTGSSDPYNKVFSTRWTKISGPSGFATIVNTISKKTRVENLSAGEYGFEFKMTDAEGLVSRDTMWIHAKSAVSYTHLR